MTLYNNTDPLEMLAGRAKKHPSKLGENAQSPEENEKKKKKKDNVIRISFVADCWLNRM